MHSCWVFGAGGDLIHRFIAVAIGLESLFNLAPDQGDVPGSKSDPVSNSKLPYLSQNVFGRIRLVNNLMLKIMKPDI